MFYFLFERVIEYTCGVKQIDHRHKEDHKEKSISLQSSSFI